MIWFTQRRDGAKICSRRDAENAEMPGARKRSGSTAAWNEGLLAQPGMTSLRSLRLCVKSFFFAPSRLCVNQFQAIR